MVKKISKLIIIAALLLGAGLFGSPVWALTDYSSMTNEELAAVRSTIRQTSLEDQEAFRAVWTERVATMTREEKIKLNATREGEGNEVGVGRGSVQ